MTSNAAPHGEERRVQPSAAATVDGAPIAYVIVLAAVVAALSFVPIPISAVLGFGGTFPLSQAVYPLVGFILGPWAGALAAGIGRVIGILVAPHTASTGLLSTVVAIVTAWAGGVLVQKKGSLWVWPPVVWALAFVAYVGRGLTVDVSLGLALASTLVNWLSILLWLSPLRALVRGWIADQSPARLAIGLALGSWIVNTGSFLVANAMFYNLLSQWPAIQWKALIGVSPVEHVFRAVVGTVVGLGVILGLRAIGLVKPAKAGY